MIDREGNDAHYRDSVDGDIPCSKCRYRTEGYFKQGPGSRLRCKVQYEKVVGVNKTCDVAKI